MIIGKATPTSVVYVICTQVDVCNILIVLADETFDV